MTKLNTGLFRLVTLTICYGLTVSAAITTSYTGTLDAANANDVFTVSFLVPNPVPVTIQTYGYGGTAHAPGGKNASGTVITPGGFDPYISVFQGTGAQRLSWPPTTMACVLLALRPSPARIRLWS